MTKQSFLKRQFQMFSPVKSSIKNETRNSTREKIDGDVKDIESIGNLVLKEGIPVSSYIIKSQKKMRIQSYWIDNLINKLPDHQDESHRKLALRTMLDSYVEELLPLKSDPDLLEEYINPQGGVRIGKILEELDMLAANISYEHCAIEKNKYPGISIVTASVDRLDLIKPLSISDLRLSGHVSYVGYSSMEVLIKMEKLQDGVFENLHKFPETNKNNDLRETLMIARFIMVARDPTTGKSIQVNPLRLENDNQKRLFQTSERQKNIKKVSAAVALTRLPPTEEEKLTIHDLFLENSRYANRKEKVPVPHDIVWMDETIMESVTFMQPQNRNIHGFVFGGYLMKLAYELAFSNASVFLKSRAKFLALDEISFRKPVPIGSILIMTSQIVYAPGSPHRSFQVAVTADVLDIEREKRDTTNVFHFTFDCDNPSVKVRRIMPKTYEESMKYVEGRRRRQAGSKLRGSRNNNTSTKDESSNISPKL